MLVKNDTLLTIRASVPNYGRQPTIYMTPEEAEKAGFWPDKRFDCTFDGKVLRAIENPEGCRKVERSGPNVRMILVGGFVNRPMTKGIRIKNNKPGLLEWPLDEWLTRSTAEKHKGKGSRKTGVLKKLADAAPQPGPRDYSNPYAHSPTAYCIYDWLVREAPDIEQADAGLLAMKIAEDLYGKGIVK